MSRCIVREPIERLNPVHVSLDPWEYALYILALGFCIEGDSAEVLAGELLILIIL